MKVFYHSTSYSKSVNFIDENDVFMGFRLQETVSAKTDFKFFKDRNAKHRIRYDSHEELNEILEGYYFDTDFMLKYHDGKNTHSTYAVFRLKKSCEKDIYLFLSSQHNGYYASGFKLAKLSLESFVFEEDSETSGDVDEDGNFETIETTDYYSEEYQKALEDFLVDEALIVETYFHNHI